ncbi:MAG: hypothetical protein O2782_18245 [bacterium]|nr:hypothetical protein [bacterium]
MELRNELCEVAGISGQEGCLREIPRHERAHRQDVQATVNLLTVFIEDGARADLELI